MKRLALLVLLIAVGAIAGPKSRDVRVKYRDVALAFVSQPLADGKVLPLIEATSGNERFGIHFAKTDATSPVIELLAENGSVMKTLSVNDILGKGSARELEVVPAGEGVEPRRVACIYSVRLSQGDVQVILKAIATGNESSDEQRLVVTFALKSEKDVNVAMRVKLPIVGSAETTSGGIILASKSGTAALAAATFPQTTKLSVEKDRIALACDAQTITAARETALLWLVIKGVASSSPTHAKSQALAAIQESVVGANEPRLVVVNTADKQKLAQADTAAYTIICANIGTGEATGVVLGNPVPRGARYLAGSATTTGTTFNVDGDAQPNSAQNLKWVLTNPLLPGEERLVSFKLVLQ
ncbi:MAG: DUF11 domain-containing protein [Ignavibacteriae bacterium]|nr:DUF11 domain-containing protein [Ignavibacteriota bacterium]